MLIKFKNIFVKIPQLVSQNVREKRQCENDES